MELTSIPVLSSFCALFCHCLLHLYIFINPFSAFLHSCMLTVWFSVGGGLVGCFFPSVLVCVHLCSLSLLFHLQNAILVRDRERKRGMQSFLKIVHVFTGRVDFPILSTSLFWVTVGQ